MVRLRRTWPPTDASGAVRDYWSLAMRFWGSTEIKVGPYDVRFAGLVSTAKVSNRVSSGSRGPSADQRLRLPAPQRDSLRLCDTTSWCSRRESNPEPWD